MTHKALPLKNIGINLNTPVLVALLLQSAVYAGTLQADARALFKELPSIYVASKYDQEVSKLRRYT